MCQPVVLPLVTVTECYSCEWGRSSVSASESVLGLLCLVPYVCREKDGHERDNRQDALSKEVSAVVFIDGTVVLCMYIYMCNVYKCIYIYMCNVYIYIYV